VIFKVNQTGANLDITLAKQITANGFLLYVDADNEYTIDIESLNELMRFQHEFGRLVLFGDEIEIYNGYRE
jgi:hypothetical protein